MRKLSLTLIWILFFVSVEELKNTALKGKPVAIGGTSGRGVVSSCSYEARRFGVHSAMPMRRALQLYPDLIIVKGDFEDYARHSRLFQREFGEKQGAALWKKANAIDDRPVVP